MAVFKIEKNNKVVCCVKVRYDTWTSERKQKKKEGFKTRREALEWENNFVNGCKNDVDITFENLIHKYMEDCKARLAKTTISNKTYIIETKLVPYFGKMPINTITVSTVRTWQNTMITNKNNYSPTYLKTLHNQELICQGGILHCKTALCRASVKDAVRQGKADPLMLALHSATCRRRQSSPLGERTYVDLGKL